MSTDFQKSKVYAWENQHVAPKSREHVPYEKLQMRVDAIWMMAGLLYPPSVIPMPKQNRRAWAKANRNTIWAPEKGLPEWVVLHEVAHSLAGTFDGDTDAHGPNYLWLYMTLLDRHMKIPTPMMMYTATQAGLKFNIGAKPTFVDRGAA
jgi:hypothetical protein